MFHFHHHITNPFRASLPSSTTTTPPPLQDLEFQAWKLDASSSGPPQLSLRSLPALNMDGAFLSRPKSSISSPNLLIRRVSSASRPYDTTSSPPPPAPQPQTHTPSPNRLQRRRHSNTVRKVSGSVPVNGTANLATIPSPTLDPPTTPDAIRLPSPATVATPAAADDSAADPDNTSPWCGAVGRATLGKSGRVIERLMAEIDKLKRELNAEILHRQETEKRESLSSHVIAGLKAENANLEQAKEVDATVLKRRDRKVEELKAELEAEKTRRVALEAQKLEAEMARDEAMATQRREVGEAKEVAKRATSHAEVLESSHRQLSAEYRQRTETFSRDLQRLTGDRDEERRKVKRLGVVVEQLKQETDRTNKLNTLMGEAFDEYKEGAESRISGMEESARRHEEEEATLREETKRVVGEARWLINVGKNANKRSEYLPLDDDVLDG